MSALPTTRTATNWLNGAGPSLVRFSGFKIKEPHGPEYFCAFSKRPVRGSDGHPCYVAAEFVKDRDSRGRPRRTAIRTETFSKRLPAADQSLDWFLSHVKLKGTTGPLSRTQRKQLARRLRQLGFRLSLSVPNPLPRSSATPAEFPAESAEPSACALSDPNLQSQVQELAGCSDLNPANAPGHVPTPENAKAQDGRVSGLPTRVRSAVRGLWAVLFGRRTERASCVNQ